MGATKVCMVMIHEEQFKPVFAFDEQVIRPSPQKPFETAESPGREPLVPCDICGRKFTRSNLDRHTTICERVSLKPKREAFQAVAQRLAHVATEDAVKPLMRDMLGKQACDDGDGREAQKKSLRLAKKKDPSRAGDTTAEQSKEIPKGHSKCQYCERTYRDEAYERHLSFCKDQHEKKLREQVAGKENPQTDLLMRRVKYRPPVPGSASKNLAMPLRKPAAAFSEQKPTPLKRPNDLAVTSSQSAMGKYTSGPKDSLEISKLANQLKHSAVSDAASALKSRLYPPSSTSSLERSSPSDYGSGESLLSRTGSMRLKNGNTTKNGTSPMGDLGYHESVLNRTGSVRIKNVGGVAPGFYTPSKLAGSPSRNGTGDERRIEKTDSALRRENAINGGTTGLRTPGNYVMERVFDPDDTLRKKDFHTLPGLSAASVASKTSHVPHHERPYPFNVASEQKERMMELHRSNSVKSKNSSVDSSSVDWDSFLKPASVVRGVTSSKSENDKFFQWDGNRFRSQAQENKTRLPDNTPHGTRKIESSPGLGRYPNSSVSPLAERRKNAPYYLSVSQEESIEEAETSESDSPLSPLGSLSSMKSSATGSFNSVKNSGYGSLSSFSSGIPQKDVPAHFDGNSASSPVYYCHNCGQRFPIVEAAFCCHCGMKRLLNIAE